MGSANLLEQQLRHSQKMESLGRLAGSIVHDVNNALAVIAGSAAVLARGLRDQPGLASLADSILDATDSATNLTRQLLTFSRASPLHRERFDVHQAIAAAATLLTRTLDPRVNIYMRLHARCHAAVGDASQLQNALLNLGLNARDAMLGGGTLGITTGDVVITEIDRQLSRLELPAGRYLELVVSDTGSGMTPEVLARAFEPFFTTKAVGQGTGLGLCAVRQAVLDHGGAIHACSRPGRGTAIRLFLPVDGEAGDDSPELCHSITTGRGTVLVADDDPRARATAAALLDHLGYDVLESHGSSAALARFARDFPAIDLVVLDTAPAQMSPRDVVRSLRAIAPDVAVVLSSGLPPALEPDLEQPGVRGLVAKPYLLANLARQVAHALAHRAA